MSGYCPNCGSRLHANEQAEVPVETVITIRAEVTEYSDGNYSASVGPLNGSGPHLGGGIVNCNEDAAHRFVKEELQAHALRREMERAPKQFESMGTAS